MKKLGFRNKLEQISQNCTNLMFGNTRKRCCHIGFIASLDSFKNNLFSLFFTNYMTMKKV